MAHIDARADAEHALEVLLALRAVPTPSIIADVAAVASVVRLPSGSAHSGSQFTIKARVEAWLAIRKVVRTLERNPEHRDLAVFWQQAIGLTEVWLVAINPFTKEPMDFAAKPASKVIKARPLKVAKDAV